MGKRLMAVLLAAALCLGLAGCGNGEEASSRPEEAAFSAEIWEAKRPKIALSLTEPDIVDTTFTHDDTGPAIARLLGQELIVYPRYARDLRKGYTDLPEEYLLLTALLGTGGALNYGGWEDSVISGLLSAFRTAEGELRQSAAASLYRYLCQQAPIAPICFKNGSVLTQWGRLSGLDPVRDNVFHGLENWVLDP